MELVFGNWVHASASLALYRMLSALNMPINREILSACPDQASSSLRPSVDRTTVRDSSQQAARVFVAQLPCSRDPEKRTNGGRTQALLNGSARKIRWFVPADARRLNRWSCHVDYSFNEYIILHLWSLSSISNIYVIWRLLAIVGQPIKKPC